MADFDYSRLDPAFAALAKPAQRALINAGIFTALDLARHTRRQIAVLHGIGPSVFPKLEAVLANAGLQFQSETK